MGKTALLSICNILLELLKNKTTLVFVDALELHNKKGEQGRTKRNPLLSSKGRRAAAPRNESATSTTTGTPFEFPSIDGAEDMAKPPLPANTLLGSVVSFEFNAGTAGCGCNTNWFLDCGSHKPLECDSGDLGATDPKFPGSGKGKELDLIETNVAAFCMTIHLCCTPKFLDPKHDAEACKRVRVTDSELAAKHFKADCDQWGCSTCSRMLKDVDPDTGKWVEPGKGVRPYGQESDAYLKGSTWLRTSWWFVPYPDDDPRPDVKGQLKSIHVEMTDVGDKKKKIYFQICQRHCTDEEFERYQKGEYMGDVCDPAVKNADSCNKGDGKDGGRHRGETSGPENYKPWGTGKDCNMGWMDCGDERCPDKLTQGPCKGKSGDCGPGAYRSQKLKKNAKRR
eukprot:g3353.t1